MGAGGPGPEPRGRPPIPSLPTRARGGTTEVARRVRTIISLHADDGNGEMVLPDRGGPGEGSVLRGMGLSAAPAPAPLDPPHFETSASETRIPRHITRLMAAQCDGSPALQPPESTPSPPPHSPTPETPPRGSGLSTLSSSDSGRAILADVDDNVDEYAGSVAAPREEVVGDAANPRGSRPTLRPAVSAITLDGGMVRPGTAPRTTSPPSGGRLAAGRATLRPLHTGGVAPSPAFPGRPQPPTTPPTTGTASTAAAATAAGQGPAHSPRVFASPLSQGRAPQPRQLPAWRAPRGRARPGTHHAAPGSPVHAMEVGFKAPEFTTPQRRWTPHHLPLHPSAVLVGAPAPRSGPRPGTAPSARVVPASAREAVRDAAWIYDWGYLATRSAEAVAEEATAAITQELPGPWAAGAGDGGAAGAAGGVSQLTRVPMEEGVAAQAAGTALTRRPATAAAGVRPRPRPRSGVGRSPVGLDGASVTIEPHTGEGGGGSGAEGWDKGHGEGESEETWNEVEGEDGAGMVVRVHARRAPRARAGLPAVHGRSSPRRKRPVSARPRRSVPRGRVLSGWE